MASTTVLPQSVCPYPGEPHAIGGQGGNQACDGCGRLLLYCNQCGAANRLMSRCCRQCGAARADQRWSMRGGEADSFLVKLSVAADAAARIRWQGKMDAPATAGALLTHGLLIALSSSGRLTIMRERVATPAYSGNLQLQSIVAAPALVDGLLVAASGGQLQVVDLLTVLKVSPETPSRDRTLQVPGTVASHLVSDGRRRLALTSVDGSKLYLHLLSVSPTLGLQLQWTRAIAATATADALYPLALMQDNVLVGEPEGQVWAYSADGKLLSQDRIEGGLAPLPWVPRNSGVLLAGRDGRIHRYEKASPLTRLCVADASDRPLFSFGASDSHLISCHGRVVRHVRLATALSTQYELPQACSLDPLVAQGLGVVFSDDGTAYVLDLGPGAGFIRWTQKLFTSQGAMPCSPVATPRTLFACGPDGEVAAVAWTG